MKVMDLILALSKLPADKQSCEVRCLYDGGFAAQSINEVLVTTPNGDPDVIYLQGDQAEP